MAIRLWLVTILLLHLTACSSDGQQESTQEAVNGESINEEPLENGSFTNNPNAQGSNNLGNNLQGEGQSNNLSENGEQINNAEGDEFANEVQNQAANEFVNQGTQQQAGGENFLANEQATGEGINNATATEDSIGTDLAAEIPVNPALEQPAIDPSVSPVVDEAAVPPADIAPESTEAPLDTLPAEPAAPPGPIGPIVKYVPGTGANIFTQAGGTEIVGRLNQGDHPLVWEDGEWARMTDGRFVQNSALTRNPVPRPKRPAVWQ